MPRRCTGPALCMSRFPMKVPPQKSATCPNHNRPRSPNVEPPPISCRIAPPHASWVVQRCWMFSESCVSRPRSICSPRSPAMFSFPRTRQQASLGLQNAVCACVQFGVTLNALVGRSVPTFQHGWKSVGLKGCPYHTITHSLVFFQSDWLFFCPKPWGWVGKPY